MGHAKLHFPRSFSPNGDNKNDYFFFKNDSLNTPSNDTTYVSIQHLHLIIFNQWGNLVFDYNDQVGGSDEPGVWKGWDGKTKLGFDAGPGVYYYTYEAIGWGLFPSEDSNNPQNRSTKLSGSGYVYLFR